MGGAGVRERGVPGVGKGVADSDEAGELFVVEFGEVWHGNSQYYF